MGGTLEDNFTFHNQVSCIPGGTNASARLQAGWCCDLKVEILHQAESLLGPENQSNSGPNFRVN